MLLQFSMSFMIYHLTFTPVERMPEVGMLNSIDLSVYKNARCYFQHASTLWFLPFIQT